MSNITTEICMVCGSINRIPPYCQHALAFTCWNCNQNCWLDNDSLQQYKTSNNITYVEAAMDLCDNKVSMIDGEFNG